MTEGHVVPFPERQPADERDPLNDAIIAAGKTAFLFVATHDHLPREQALGVLAGEVLCQYAAEAGAADAAGLAECFIRLGTEPGATG